MSEWTLTENIRLLLCSMKEGWNLLSGSTRGLIALKPLKPGSQGQKLAQAMAFCLRRISLLGLMLPVALPAAVQSALSARTRDQIQALQEEKQARTPAQRKLDSQLVYGLHQKRHRLLAASLTAHRPSLVAEKDGRILVDINANVSSDLLKFIEQQGGLVVGSYPRYRTIRALIPLELAELLGLRPEVRSVRPADECVTNSQVAPEGDVAHTANLARQAFSVDGSGLKIGVLSDGIDYLVTAQNSGLMPPVTVLPDQDGSGAEGAAMLEIVHSLAPGSELYFATANGSVASFAQNIRDLYAAGCRIIVDDITYFNESPFQDGPISQAVNDVSAAGGLYFSAVGNFGNKDLGTSGTWEGDFADGGDATIGRGGRLLDFGGATSNTRVGGASGRVDLFWTDPLGASTNDYDVYVLDSSGSVVRSSTNIQDGSGDPYESISTLNLGESVVIVKVSGEARFLSLHTGRAVLSMSTTGSTRGHNASSASNAFSIAATQVSSPPAPFVSSAQLETFCSDGPRRMFFNPDGSAITPGNYSSTGGTLVQKPDLTGADGVSTTVPGYLNFRGTSAAAPHAAAIAALLWSYSPYLTPSSVRALLTGTALDIGSPGPDRDSGAGIVMAYPALAASPRPVVQSIQINDANGNGSLDANECANLVLTLGNSASPTSLSLTGITAVLDANTPEIRFDPAPRAFPDLPPQGTSTAPVAFRVSTSPLFPCGTNATLDLELATASQLTFRVPFQPNSIIAGATPPNILSASGPLPIPDLGQVDSTISVSGIKLPLAKVQVSVFITHPYDYDLRLTLIGPDGTQVLLSANRGDSGQNYGADCASMTVFSDDALTTIAAGSAPFLGTFQPEEPLAAFFGKNGAEVNGAWTLRVEDQIAGDVGALQCWSLALSSITCVDGGGQCLIPPQIASSPASLAGLVNGTAQFTVSVQSKDLCAYQWYFNQTNILTGATNQSLVLSNLTAQQAGTYLVVVSNAYGMAISDPAQLTVSLPEPATIVTPLTDQTATNGDTVSFAVSARGTEPLSFQWFFNATNALPAATNATLTLSNISRAQAGTYKVVVSNVFGMDTNSAVLSVILETSLACAPDRTVKFGTAWDFDPPAVSGNNVSLMVLGTLTNAGCGQGFSATRTWLLTDIQNHQAACSQTLQVLDLRQPILSNAPDKTVSAGSNWNFDAPTALAAGASVSLVYDNWTNNLSAQLDTGSSEVGNQIAPPGSARYPVRFAFGYWATNAQAGGFAGSLVAKVRFYANDGAPMGAGLFTPGTVLFDSGPLPLVAAAQGTMMLENFQLGAAVPLLAALPTTFTWTVQFSGLGPQDAAGLALYGPPVVGGAVTEYWEQGSAGWVLRTTTVSPANFGAQLFATDRAAILSEVGTVTNVECGQSFSATRTWQAVDACGNTATCSQTVTIPDQGIPGITSQPASQIVIQGDTATFKVSVSSCSPVTYQWYFNQTNSLPGQTNGVLVLSSVQPGQAGGYFVVASSATGGATSQVALLSVLVPATILSQPTDQVATNGDTVTFALTAQGKSPLTYQWYFNQTNVITDETNTTLILRNVTPADAGSYLAVVSNPYGNTTSAPALLTVFVRPTIVTNPTDQIAANGGTARFSVVALGTEPLVYQWYFEGAQVAGGTASTLLLNNISIADAGSYAVTVSNPYGQAISTPAALTVLEPPTILQQPASQAVAIGATLGLTVSADGTAPLAYQWFFNGAPLQAATSASLIISPFQAAQAGAYTVVVTNMVGAITSEVATVQVQSPPVIVGQPQSQTVAPGTTVIYSVGATGTLPLSYQWLLDGNPLPGATANSLVLPQVTANQAGVYQALVTNLFGAATSLPATLSISNSSGSTGLISLSVTNGDTARFSFSVSGGGTLSYQWFFNQTNLLFGATNAWLVLSNVTLAQSGRYSVAVSNGFYGFRTDVGDLTVIMLPEIVSAPTNQVVVEGQTVSLTIAAEGSAPLAIQWFFNQTNSLGDATNTTLILSNVSPDLSGSYLAVVTNDYGSATSPPVQLTVIVPEPAAIVTGLKNQVATNGDTVILAVSAQGTEPLTYRWFFNATNVLPDATNATLELDNVMPQQSGTYAVVVSNTYGADSNSATLVVLAMPRLICVPDHTVELGTAWDFDVPTVIGSNLSLSTLSTVTNAGCGQAFDARRTWLLTDGHAFQSVCSQTVRVVDTAPPVINCVADKSVQAGSTWVFDAPTAQAARANAHLAYDNWTNNLAMELDPGPAEVGSEIFLAGSATYPVRFSFAYWATNAQQGGFAGSPTVDVRFYRNDGTALGTGQSGPGTVLFDSGLLPLEATPQGSVVLGNFQLGAVVPLLEALPVPFTWTVQFSGLGSNDSAGLAFYGPPVVGAVLSRYWEHVAQGWIRNTNGPALGNFAAQLVGTDQGVVLSAAGTVTNVACGQSFTATRTWQAVDVCGNSSTCSQTVTVTDNGLPAITGQPQNQVARQGGTAMFTVSVSSCIPFSYQWYFNQTNLLSGQTNINLVLTNMSLAQVGDYAVVASTAVGSSTSLVAQVRLGVPPSIVNGPTDQVVTNGDTATFAVMAQGEAPLAYQWFFNQTNNLMNQTNATLALTDVSLDEMGNYVVVVSNLYGNVTSSPALLTVLSPPTILTQPQDQSVMVGQNVTFIVEARANPAPAYQWFFNGTAIAGATARVLTLTQVQSIQFGEYSVLITNTVGSVLSLSAFLSAGGAPRLLIQPAGITVVQGGNAELSVRVAGTAPLSFQWYLNGTIPIANGTQRTLVLTNVQFADSGNYTVSVFNSLGSVLSQPATLRVLVPPDLLSFTLTGNVAGFTISTLPGLLYTISYADVPTSSIWTQLPKGFQRLGTGQPLSFQDPRASTSQRYYRIQVE